MRITTGKTRLTIDTFPVISTFYRGEGLVSLAGMQQRRTFLLELDYLAGTRLMVI